MSQPSPEDPGLALPAGLTAAQRQAVVGRADVLCVLAGAGAGKPVCSPFGWPGGLGTARRTRPPPGHHVQPQGGRRAPAAGCGCSAWPTPSPPGRSTDTALTLLRQHRAGPGLSGTHDPRRPAVRAAQGSAGVVGRRRDEQRVNGARGLVAQLDTEIGWAKARMISPDGYESAARAHGRRSALSTGDVAQLYQRYEEARRRRDALTSTTSCGPPATCSRRTRRSPTPSAGGSGTCSSTRCRDVNPAQFRLLASVVGDTPTCSWWATPINRSTAGTAPTPSSWTACPNAGRPPPWCGSTRTTGARPDRGRGLRRPRGRPVRRPGPTSTRPDGPVPRVSAHATDAEEATWVAHEAWLAHRPGRQWSHLAVLARTNAQLTTVAQAFDKARIPYHLAGGELGPASDVVAAGAPEHRSPRSPPGRGRRGRRRGSGAAREDGVVLTTFHRAKGLQWPVVFVVGLGDGLVPIPWATTEAALDEERRLLYVALTRAEDELFCSWSLYRDARLAGTGWRPRRPSPWLAAMETVGPSWPGPSARPTRRRCAPPGRDPVPPGPDGPARRGPDRPGDCAPVGGRQAPRASSRGGQWPTSSSG